MAIRFPTTAPTDGHETIESHLSRQRRTATTRGLRRLSAQPGMQLSDGIQAWTVELTDAEAGQALDAAKPHQWRYLVFEGADAIAEAHLRAAATGSVVSAMAHGPSTDGLVRALAVAEGLPQVAEHDYEPRVLLVPAIVFVGLWLHSDDADDLVIPIPPTQLSLKVLAPYDAAAVAAAIQTAAAEVRAQIKAAPGPSGGSGTGSSTSEGGDGVPRILRLRALDPGARRGRRHQHGHHQHGHHQHGHHHQSPQQQSPQQQGPTDEEPEPEPTEDETELMLPEFMQHQEQSNWCWSAVGTSVGLLFETGSWTQCATATALLSAGDCCSDPGPCNVYGYLDKSLQYTQSLDSWDSGTAPTNVIQDNIDAGHPVCTRVAWTGGGAHFMAITGYSYPNDDPNDVTIWIQDSIYGTSSMPYAEYPAQYHSGGTWTTTYFTKPS